MVDPRNHPIFDWQCGVAGLFYAFLTQRRHGADRFQVGQTRPTNGETQLGARMNVKQIVTEFLLVATASTVLVLQGVAPKTERQTLVPIQPGDASAVFSLPADDPFVAELRKQWWEHDHPTPTRAATLSRWESELAGFYASALEAEASEDAEAQMTGSQIVAQVTHIQKDVDLAVSDPALSSYWQDRGVIAQQRLEHEVAIQEQTRVASEPRFALGPVLAPRHSITAIGCSIAAGVLLAVLFVAWSMVSLPVVHRAIRTSSVPDGETTGTETVVVDPSWIRTKQPLRVTCRRLTLITVVLLGMTTAATQLVASF